ncbi:hypothetical protein H4Q26_016959 [Puccinia striiformis f. sp. tritici PST-130]|nr:hypothetical protein H4Q26_016959 [Puccinia striiformis f. sp. tritici PST-130]
MDEFKAAQLAITQAQDSKIGEVKGDMQEVKGNMQEVQSDMREMKEMFKMFLNQAKAPENIPIPATPEPGHQPDLQLQHHLPAGHQD